MAEKKNPRSVEKDKLVETPEEKKDRKKREKNHLQQGIKTIRPDPILFTFFFFHYIFGPNDGSVISYKYVATHT